MDELTATLLAARNGDDAALTSFVQQTRPAVWRFVAHLVDPRAADDLTQDTFLRAVRALPGYRGDASARTWLLAIARRACMDELRVRTRQRRRDAKLSGLRAEDTVPDIAPESDSAALLRMLNPDRRAAFVLTQLISLSYAEAAEILGVPIGTIRSRVARARADLIEQLEGPAGTERADQSLF
ncbi:MAG TPA: sigma-70 family RNA polymerase sigma factor [Mycobacteriales bacterium]|nr:sigma-70 family RNA polymerase sigma factor [Mycobacteriales bacterium]